MRRRVFAAAMRMRTAAAPSAWSHLRRCRSGSCAMYVVEHVGSGSFVRVYVCR